MEIRGEEVLLPVSAVSAFPRPHWLQGRIFGSQYEPTYRSHNLRVAYEDACKLTAREQEAAGLHVLCDGAQYYEWEAPGFQLEPIFHFIPEMLGGITNYGPPGDGVKYKPFYKGTVNGKVEWVRPIFEGVCYAMQLATDRPFKIAFLGPAQQSVILDDQHYGDGVELAKDIARALNKEMHFLQDMGCEAVQLIDVLAPYTTDMWQIECQHIMWEGITMTKFWHVCYGSVDGQRDVFDNHAHRDDAAVRGVARRRHPPGDVEQGLRRAGRVRRLPEGQGARRRAWSTRRTRWWSRWRSSPTASAVASRWCPPTGCWSRRTAGWATSAARRPTRSCATWARPPTRSARRCRPSGHFAPLRPLRTPPAGCEVHA